MNDGCGTTEALIARVLSGNATRADLDALRAHAASCAACAARETRLRKVWELMGRAPAISSTRSVSYPRPAFRRAWAAGLAAAALAAVLGGVLLRSPAGNVGPGTAEVPVAPEAARPADPEPEQAREERVRVEEVLEEITREKLEQPRPLPPPAPVPERKEAVAEAPPRPNPEPQAVQAPEPPKPAPPEVAREEKPVPAPAPPAPPRETLPAVAMLDRVQGAVFALIEGKRVPGRADLRLLVGEGVETVGAGSQAVLEFADGSRVVLGSDTSLTGISEPARGKRLSVARGVVAAQVAKQDHGEPFVFATPHAEARVLGTRLSLNVTDVSTRCEVKEGRVRLSRLDGGFVELGPDQYAVAGRNIALSVRSAPGSKVVVREAFDRGRWQPFWAPQADPSSGLKLAVKDGSLSLQFGAKPAPQVSSDHLGPGTSDAAKKALDQVTRVAALGSRKDWPRSASLEIRQAFAPSNETPLRIRVRLWHAQADEDRITGIALNRSSPAHGLSLERRGATVQLWSEATQAALWKKEVPCAQEWETLELWITRDQVAVRREGLTLHAGPNPVKAKALQVSIGGHARQELAQDGETRFDDVEIGWMTKADFEDISK